MVDIGRPRRPCGRDARVDTHFEGSNEHSARIQCVVKKNSRGVETLKQNPSCASFRILFQPLKVFYSNANQYHVITSTTLSLPLLQDTMKLSSRLSRSAIDATRFTATSPHAYSKPTRTIPSSTSSSTPNARANPQSHRIPKPNAPKRPPQPGSAAKPTETPVEKVARLRAARIAEREAQVTSWDTVVVKGRSWADSAHKVTVYTLVAFSGAPLSPNLLRQPNLLRLPFPPPSSSPSPPVLTSIHKQSQQQG